MSFQEIISYVLNLDAHLRSFVDDHGAWTYAAAGAIVFAETGLVVAPFLPGDSLLFALGAIAATMSKDNPPTPLLSLWALLGWLTLAAVLGNTVNYFIGRRVGIVAVKSGKVKFVNQEHIDRTHAFFEKHGGKSVVISRFVPIIRTIAPFIAGAGQMDFLRFQVYNVVGAVAWVGSCIVAGHQFGNIPFVKEHFSLVVLAVVAISLIPIAVTAVSVRLQARKASAEASAGSGASAADAPKAKGSIESKHGGLAAPKTDRPAA